MHLIVGMGEVGQAYGKILDEVKINYVHYDIKDKNDNVLKNHNFSFIHICIPFISENVFLRSVNDIAIETETIFEDPIFIIHTTTNLGTIDKLQDLMEIDEVYHMPVRGTHPDLFGGIKSQMNMVGFAKGGKFVSDKMIKMLYSLKIPFQIYESSKESELGKLINNWYYSLNIAFVNQIKLICDRYDVNFEDAYSKSTFTDRIGRIYEYDKNGRASAKENILRPVMIPGEMGGHCLRVNMEFARHLAPDMFNWVDEMDWYMKKGEDKN